MEPVGGESITVCLRNPARHSDFCLKVSPSSSLHELKLAIQRAYDGNPAPEAQTLIYGGKVLKDANLRLTDILPQPLATDAPHNLHLVVRPPSPGAEVRPTSSGSSSASSSAGGGSGAGSGGGGVANARGAPSMPATPALSRATSSAPRQGPGSSAGPAAAPAAAAALHVPLTAGALPGISAVYGATTTHTSLPGAWPALAAGSAGLAPGAVPPCFMLNPVAAAAYQAAYAAALGVAQSMAQAPGSTAPLPQQQQQQQQQQQVSQQVEAASEEAGAGPSAAAGAAGASSSSGAPDTSAAAAQTGATMGVGTLPQYVPPPFPGAAYALYYPQTYALAQQVMQQQMAMQQQRAGAAGAPGQPQQGVPLQVLPPGVPLVGMMPVGGLAPHPGAAVQGAWPAAMRYRLRAVRHGLGGAAAPGGPAGAGGLAAGAAQLGAQPHAGARRRRARVVTLQISVRTLLQLVVFGVLLYQHCSWQRLLALGAGAAALWAFNSWAPLRQFIASLLVPPPAPAAAAPPHAPPHFGAAAPDHQQPPPAAAPAAAQEQQQQQPPPPPEQQQAPAPAQQQAAQPPGNSPLRPQGLVREVVTVLVGLVMSLVPGFGQNAEDAAVFQAAQEMMAREAAAAERRRRRAGDDAAAAAAGGRPE